MGFTCRSLLGRVNPYRPDIEPGMIDYAIQEAARRLTKEAYLMQVRQFPFLVERDTDRVLFSSSVANPTYARDYSLSTDQAASRTLVWTGVQDTRVGREQLMPAADLMNNPVDVHRIMSLRVSQLSTTSYEPATFMGYYGLSGVTLPDPATTNQFLMVAVPEFTPVDPLLTDLGPLGVGDIIQYNGSEWQKYTLEQYITIPQINQPTINQVSQQIQATNQFSFRWSQYFGQTTLTGTPGDVFYTDVPANYSGMYLNIIPQTLNDMIVDVVYACVPVGDFGMMELPYPIQARDTIIAGALAEVMAYPGANQNLQMAMQKKREYEDGKAELRAIGTLGYGGSPMMSTPTLTSLYGVGWGWNTGMYMP